MLRHDGRKNGRSAHKVKADLHIHSVFSNDGRSTIGEIIASAKLRGLGCIAVTDHNSFESYDLLKDTDDLIIIPGEEVSSKDGHILAYGIDCEIERDMSIPKTIDAIHDAHGIAVAAHPYRWWSGLGEKNVTCEFDAIETFNARSKAGSNAMAFRLAANMGKPVTGGSDSHTPESIGSAYTVFGDGVRTKEDVIKAILDRGTETGGTSRTASESLRYGGKSISEWIGRGFRRM